MSKFEEMCRACLEQKGNISLFSRENNGPCLADLILECTSLTIECGPNVSLPNMICESCTQKLNICKDFKSLCWDSDAKLKNKEFKMRKRKKSLKCIGTILQNKRNSDGKKNSRVLTGNLKETDENSILDEVKPKKEKALKGVRKKNVKQPKKGDGMIENITSDETQLTEVIKELPKREKDIKELYYTDNFQFVLKRKQKKKRRLTHYMCDTCGYRANDAYSLRVHTRFHTGERPFACTMCSKRFVVGVALRAHVARHLGRPACVCEVCGRGCASLSALAAHQRSAHRTAGRAHACALCPRAFVLASNLRAHERTHSGDKPHKCPTCIKSFTTSSDLKGHIRTHTGDRPFPCGVCSKRFSLRSNLKVHLRTHSGERNYHCAECGKSFIHKSSLKSHQRIHSGVRPHACKTCDARFTHPNSLRVHMIVHGATQAHDCPVCNKRFTRVSSLNAHKKRHKLNELKQENKLPANDCANSNMASFSNDKRTVDKIQILNDQVVESNLQIAEFESRIVNPAFKNVENIGDVLLGKNYSDHYTSKNSDRSNREISNDSSRISHSTPGVSGDSQVIRVGDRMERGEATNSYSRVSHSSVGVLGDAREALVGDRTERGESTNSYSRVSHSIAGVLRNSHETGRVSEKMDQGGTANDHSRVSQPIIGVLYNSQEAGIGRTINNDSPRVSMEEGGNSNDDSRVSHSTVRVLSNSQEAVRVASNRSDLRVSHGDVVQFLGVEDGTNRGVTLLRPVLAHLTPVHSSITQGMYRAIALPIQAISRQSVSLVLEKKSEDPFHTKRI